MAGLLRIALAMMLLLTSTASFAESGLASQLARWRNGTVAQQQQDCSETCWNGNRHSITACGGSVTDVRGCQYNCNRNARGICDEQGCCVCQRLAECE